jgi:hypothetical protein
MMDKKTNKKTATKAVTSGKIKELEWEFIDGVLSISGDGEIPNYDDYTKKCKTDEGRSPWYPLREKITKIVFKGDITKKGLYVFHGCKNLLSVTFEKDTFPGDCVNIIDHAMQGYGLVDMWNIDSWFLRQICRILQEFIQKSDCGGPGNMSSEEWDSILARMVFCFKEANEETCSMKNEFQTEYINYFGGEIKPSPELEKSYYDKREEIESYREAMLNEGLELFRKHFRSLWW